jgi:acyl-coenzyme A thioesterase PaaI-like protein
MVTGLHRYKKIVFQSGKQLSVLYEGLHGMKSDTAHDIGIVSCGESQGMDRKLLPVIDLRCFGCGSDNPYGLRMRFESDGARLYSRLVVPEHLRGWSNLVHGGVISTILDEVMSWAAICISERLILTKKMEVEFLLPVLVNEEIFAEGWAEEIISDRSAVMAGKIMDSKGRELARAKGSFALLKKSSFDRLGITVENLPNSIESLLQIVSDLKKQINGQAVHN